MQLAGVHLRPRLRLPRLRGARRGLLAALLALGLLVGSYRQMPAYSDDLASLSRSLIGDENTARIEARYFAAKDRVDRLKYSIFGDGSSNPFAPDSVVVPAERQGLQLQSLADQFVQIPPPPAKPAPLGLPETRPLAAKPVEGEGAWTSAGLRLSSPQDPLMARTFIKPDATRPYATVGVLLFDKRRVRLHITGGLEDPGGDRGVEGPGVIPDEHRKDLLVAWNGGFRGPHGGYGMYADGKTYRPLRNGLASIAITRDGEIKMGEWGRSLVWSEEILSVRQNAVLLVDNCELSKRTKEGNNTWGYVQVNSAEFITWRSAVGLTQNGDLLVAAGNSLSAETLGKALVAAGACTAMQLDINTPYVLISLFHAQPDKAPKASKFMDAMIDNPNRFLGRQRNDFMYVTLDESKFKP